MHHYINNYDGEQHNNTPHVMMKTSFINDVYQPAEPTGIHLMINQLSIHTPMASCLILPA